MPVRRLTLRETFASGWRAARSVIRRSPVFIGVLAVLPLLVTLAMHSLGFDQALQLLSPSPREGVLGLLTSNPGGYLGSFSVTVASFVFTRRIVVSSPAFDAFRVRPAWLFALVSLATLFVISVAGAFSALLLVLPGIYIFLVTSFGYELSLFDGTAPFSAMGLSRDLLRDEREGKRSRWFGPAFWKATALLVSITLLNFLGATAVRASTAYVTRLAGDSYAWAQPLSFIDIGVEILLGVVRSGIVIVFLAERLTFGRPEARERLIRLAGVRS